MQYKDDCLKNNVGCQVGHPHFCAVDVDDGQQDSFGGDVM